MNERTKKINELIISIFLILFTIWMYYLALTAKGITGAGRRTGLSSFALPKVFLVILFIFAAIQLIRTMIWFTKNRNKSDPVFMFENKIPYTYLALIIYAILWKYIGFTLSTFIIFCIVSKLLESERTWKQVLLLTTLFTIGSYLIFGVFFQIPLYEPFLRLL